MYVGNNFFQVLSGIGCPPSCWCLGGLSILFRWGKKNGTFLVAETKPVMSPD